MDAVGRNSIYYWKTFFDIDLTEMSFLQRRNISRVYLRMFDVAIEQNYQTGSTDIVPIATTELVSSVPKNVEIVPVTYITIDALRAMIGREVESASLIVERLLAMSSYNECGKISEIQLDCDWTNSTKSSYPKMLVPDNLKAAFVKTDRYEPSLNRVMEDMANHYGSVMVPARPVHPKDKSNVETDVKLVYMRVFAELRNETFYFIDELNRAAALKMKAHNQKRMQKHPYTREERFWP